MDAEERARYIRHNERTGAAAFGEGRAHDPVDEPDRVLSKTKWVSATQHGSQIDTGALAAQIDAAVRTLTEGITPDRVMSVNVAAAGHGFSALVTVVYVT